MDIIEFKDNILKIVNQQLKEYFNFTRIEINESKREVNKEVKKYDITYTCSNTISLINFSNDSKPEIIDMNIDWSNIYCYFTVKCFNETFDVKYENIDEYHTFYVNAFDCFMKNQIQIVYTKAIQEKFLTDMKNITEDKMKLLEMEFRDNKINDILN